MRRKGRESGATAVEFALLSPLLILMVAGITGYGGYFWISHSVQQIANDSARAAIAGLNSSERASLAQQTVSDEVLNYGGLDPSRIRVTVADNASSLAVQVSYDASGSPFWAVQGLAPMPSTTVMRQASIRLGGY
jgi:Flp pilus assembly protein TadG